jgi:hypothetical protein
LYGGWSFLNPPLYLHGGFRSLHAFCWCIQIKMICSSVLAPEGQRNVATGETRGNQRPLGPAPEGQRNSKTPYPNHSTWKNTSECWACNILCPSGARGEKQNSFPRVSPAATFRGSSGARKNTTLLKMNRQLPNDPSENHFPTLSMILLVANSPAAPSFLAKTTNGTSIGSTHGSARIVISRSV